MISSFEPDDTQEINLTGPSGIKLIKITATAESPDFDTLTYEATGIAIFNIIFIRSS
jgi:hypothetical protein